MERREREREVLRKKGGKNHFYLLVLFSSTSKNSRERGSPLSFPPSEMPSRNKRRIPEGESADTKRPASAAGQASSVIDIVGDAGPDAAACPPPPAATSVSSVSSHDLHANLPLFVTGPALVQATSGAAWCHGWRLQSIQQGDGDDATLSPPSPSSRNRRLSDLAVPAGAVVRLEAAPLGPGDVPLTARSCRVQVTVPKGHAGAAPPVSRALPRSGAAAAAAAAGGGTGGAAAGAAAAAAATAAATLPPPPPASWRAAAASIAAGAVASVAAGGGPPSVVVIGPKNAGKSSFARLLTNELLSSFSAAAAAADLDAADAAAANDSRSGASASAFFPSAVAWCDVDCGQPELTPPGLVSLSHVSRPLLASGGISSGGGGSGGGGSGGGGGGGFLGGGSSVQRPERAHFLGALSPASDPDRACAAAASLLSWHWQHGGVESWSGSGNGGAGGVGGNKKRGKTAKTWPPLVVNSAGWVRGAGLDLLAAALAAARPTHVVRLSTGSAERDAPAVFELFEGGRLPPFLEVVELPALSSSNGSSGFGFGFGSGGDTAEEDGEAAAAAAAPPSSLFQGVFPAPTNAASPSSSSSSSSRYSAADTRAAMWLSFARSCVESAAADCGDGGGGEEVREQEEEEEEGAPSPSSADLLLLSLPAALAAARPMVLPLSSLRLEFLGERPSGGLQNALRALNGSVVALATAAEAGKGVGEEEDSSAPSALPSPTASLALVRGVDGRRGLVHLLCPLRSAEAAAAGVVALQVGHCSLELPPALLAGGVVSSAAAGVSSARQDGSNGKEKIRAPIAVSSSPYLAPWCLAAGGTGARAAKARNDLARGGGGGGARC